MTPTIKTIAIICSFIFIGTVLYLLVQRKLNERHSVYWIICAVMFLIFSIFSQVLDYLSKLAGVSYPPSLLFFFGTLMIIFFLLYQSSQVAALQEKVKELAQTVAILNMKSDEKSAQFICAQAPKDHVAAAIEEEEKRCNFNKHG